MSMDWLDLATGALALPASDEETSAKLAAAKKRAAADFLIAGGRLSPADWAALTEDSRRAFVAAGVALELDRAATLSAEIMRRSIGAGA